ncbi:hypothetical protein ACFY1L_16810 [Streptomyces sp. NPDC001663]|uniref:hypothetical protein n=1 Tax=Streptomyces sp. NPDC001663 TaxID=3364597 RepID=UPI0036BC0BBE
MTVGPDVAVTDTAPGDGRLSANGRQLAGRHGGLVVENTVDLLRGLDTEKAVNRSQIPTT